MIAKRLTQFDSSQIRKAFDRAAAAPNAIDLSIGYPEDNTPEYIKAAGIRAITDNQTRYVPSNGLLELRTAISEKLILENRLPVSPDLVTITPGVTTGILLTYMAILDPGDEVLLPDPYFPPYKDLATLVGAKVVPVNTYPHFQISTELLQAKLSPRTKAIVINSPNNPSGAIYPEAELRRIAAFAKKHDLYIISDEIYEYFSYDVPHFSIGSIYPKTITLNGFSKAYAMTGWRIGYIAGPSEVIAAINELQQYVVFSSSSVGQYAALAALRHGPNRLVKKYLGKKEITKRYLSNTFNLNGSQGAFFAFVQLPYGIQDIDFVNEIMRRGVVVLPSRAFSERTDHFRIAFSAEYYTLIRALKIIRSYGEELQLNNDHLILPGAVQHRPQG